MQAKLKLIIGLGNPGKEYERSYHNIGFLFLDFVSEKLEDSGRTSPESKTAGSGKFSYRKISELYLVKPLTYMNNSGLAAAQAAKYFKVKAEEILVAHDDSDIALGSYKLAFAKNSAGHKGVESIIKSLGTKNFWRLRIGIRPHRELRTPRQRTKAMELVMKPVNRKDILKINLVFRDALNELKIT